MNTLFWLFIGVVASKLFILLARSRGEQENRLLATGLIVAALIYVGFGLGSGSVSWIGIEVGGLVLYGVCAWLGIKYHPMWIAVGWGLHPVWDAGLHLTGMGSEFVPYWYAILCLSFDLYVAGYIAIQSLNSRAPVAHSS